MIDTQLQTVKICAVVTPSAEMTDDWLRRGALEVAATKGALTTLDHLRGLIDQFDNVQIDDAETLSPTEQAILAGRNWVSYIDAVSKQ